MTQSRVRIISNRPVGAHTVRLHAKARGLLCDVVMETVTDQLPSIFDHFPRVATTAKRSPRRGKIGLWTGLVGISAGAGIAVALGSGKRGLITGGVAALALGALRWQLARWFTETPAYDVEGTLGALELRRYPVRIEARAEVEDRDFESALDTGYGRLACYVYGANTNDEDLVRTTPVLVTMRDGAYTTSFVMPPGRDLGSLPHPDDPRLELREVPARRIAALGFHGRFTNENVEAHERALLKQLVDAGLSARGSVVFAAYDSPATLPMLRRNELWIEVM
jgi:hypothetical protein